MRERIAKRRSLTGASINMWPFVGVSIALLIVMMLITGTPYHYRPWGGSMELALSVHAASEPRAVREDSIRVAITRDGSLFFRNVKIVPNDLPKMIRDAVQNGAERKVYLAVDARAKYGDVKMVYDAIAEGGVNEISLIAEKVVPPMR
jgi:biopolymer transport protein ExbD